MARIISNEKLSPDTYILKIEDKSSVKPGQFYMIRAWNSYPVLSRPISVLDADGSSVSFLYKTVGEGTRLFSELKSGNQLTALGPLGNSFPELPGKIALVGGGVGIAPLYFWAKSRAKPDTDIYLGFSKEVVMEDDFKKVSGHLTINAGGYVTDDIDPRAYDYILTCGPDIMMKTLYKKCCQYGKGSSLYISVENRMACGIGACLVCTCKTKNGNRKACKDGPVFAAEEVFA